MVPSDQTDTTTRALLGMVVAMIGLAAPIEKTMGCLSIFRPLIAPRAIARVRNKILLGLEPFHAVALRPGDVS